MDYKVFEKKRVLIAVSTGVDSMVLLHKLLQLDCAVFVVYVRHHHRINVHKENEFFTKYCEDLNINLTTYDYHHKSGNFESVAREYRYKCFDEVYKKYNCDYLLTAHHGDDLVETILMRQLRGSDINGYGGFREFSKRGEMNVARPLLEYSKKDLRDYASEHNVPYYEDETNADISYQRNFLRHEVIPKFGQNYIKKFVKYSRDTYEVSDYIDSVVSNYVTIFKDVYIDVVNIDRLIFKYAVKKSLSHLYGENITMIHDKHMHLILEMQQGDKIQLPNKYFVFHNGDNIVFSKCEDESYEYEYSDSLEVKFLNSKIEFGQGESLYLSEDVELPLKVVNSRSDMIIENKNGRQKMNRVFINAKVPMHKRNSWPVLIDGNNRVVCVFGIKYSKLCVKSTTTYKYMIQYYCNFKGDDFSGK